MAVAIKFHLRRNSTAVKPAAVQKNTVKPAANKIKLRVYYYDYGNHRNNTKGTRFQSAFLLDARQNGDIITFFGIYFFCTSALIFVLFIGVFDGSVLLYFSTFQIIARFIILRVENEIWDINPLRGLLRPHF